MPKRDFFKLILIVAAMLTLFGCKEEDDPKISTAEGLYINEVYASSGEDWIELYNDNDESKDISGYRIYDDTANKYTLPAGTTIDAKGFLVLICDDGGTGLHTTFKLSSTGETVSFENSSNRLVDFVTYPAINDGEAYGRFPDGSQNLGTTAYVTKGSSNGDKQSAIIKSVSRTPLVPELSEAVTVSAEVLSNSGVSAVKLFYRVDGGSFSEKDMVHTGTNLYTAQIPAINNTGNVEYYVSATNSFSITALNPFDAPVSTYSYLLNTDPLPGLRINEFMADNSACCPDQSSGANEFDDWIEIYNAGSVVVNLAGMYVSDDPANPFKYKIPDTNSALTSIQPGGFLVIWADEQGTQGELHANFKLSSAGEQVGLYYIDGRTIHSYTFGAQRLNKSYGTLPDGGTTWQLFSTPSPGQTNY